MSRYELDKSLSHLYMSRAILSYMNLSSNSIFWKLTGAWVRHMRQVRPDLDEDVTH